MLFANLVDFDTLYGHRNDVPGFERALREFDDALPAIAAALREDDLLFITADHGNDPTTGSTDHARECVPLLALGDAVHPVRARRAADLLGSRRDGGGVAERRVPRAGHVVSAVAGARALSPDGRA